jgi:formimidoylglutamate deiminase
VDERWCLVHATHMTDIEMTRLAASGAVAGLCPTTEANLGDGLFPLGDYLDAGGRLGIGSDSHISVSPVEELRWLEYGQRLVSRHRNIGVRRSAAARRRPACQSANCTKARAPICWCWMKTRRCWRRAIKSPSSTVFCLRETRRWCGT